MTKLTITLETLRAALENHKGKPIDEGTIAEICQEVDRLRTTGTDELPAEGQDGLTSVKGVLEEAEKEAVDSTPTDESLAGDDQPPEPVNETGDAVSEPTAEGTRIVKPRQKMQKLVVLMDPENKLNGVGDFMAYPIEIPDDDPPDGSSFNRRLMDAVNEHNESKRGRKHPVTTMREAMETIPYEWMRPKGIRMLTESQVFVLVRGSELPTT